MRISNQLLTDRVLNNLSQVQNRLLKWHTQGSSGRKINVPSDDPAGTVTSLRHRTKIAEMARYTRNNAEASEWLTVTEHAISDLQQNLHRVREIAVAGASSSQSSGAYHAMKEEIEQIIEHFVAVGNSSHNGRYLFAGHQTGSPAFTRDGDDIDYEGDAGKIVREIGQGITLQINVNGGDLLGNVFPFLIEVRDALDAGDAGAVSALLDDLNQVEDGLLRERVRMGATMKRAEQTEMRLEDAMLMAERLLSEVQDADMAEVAMRLHVEEASYRHALSVGGRIIQPTLMDFLR